MKYRNIAINLIIDYVLRGDSLDDLRKSCLGYCSDKTWVAIHGNAWKDDKLIYSGKPNDIVVSQINNKECCYVFKLDKLFKEIKSGQMELI